MQSKVFQDKLTKEHHRMLKRKAFQVRLLEHWWFIAVAVLAIYIALPISAPILMKVGATGPANGIYKAYSFMCHQFAFRSVFLFGEQTYYPRESTGTSLETFETRAPQSETFINIYKKHREKEFSGEYNPDELNQWSQAL